MIGLPGNSLRVTSLSICREGGYALLRVSDSGRGLERETLNKAFDPLFSTKQYGFGMGPTLSKNLVEFPGGELQLSSQEAGRKVRLRCFVCRWLAQSVMSHLSSRLSLRRKTGRRLSLIER